MRNARLERNVTQVQLADLLGVGQSMVEQIEGGQREPGDALLAKINKWIASRDGVGPAPRGAYRR